MPMKSKIEHSLRFRPDIEGLRAVAVMLVVADHLDIPGFGGGFLGVDVFFVISGYLITMILSREFELSRDGRSGGRVSISAFYARRARRILPAAMLVIAIVLVAAKLWFNSLRFEQVQASAFWAALFLANFDLMNQATDYFAQSNAVSPLQNYWSLAVEEQFYLVWPLLLMIAGRLGWSREAERRGEHDWRRRASVTIVAVTVASLVWSAIDTASNPAGAYYSPFTRAYELGIGATLAMFTPALTGLSSRLHQVAGLAGVGLMALGLVLLGSVTEYPGIWALLPTVGAALVILAGLETGSGDKANSNPVSLALSARPVRFLGRISYSIYLWHWPIIVFAATLYPGLIGWERVAVLLPLILVVSWLCFRSVEQPFRTVGRGTSDLRAYLSIEAGRLERLQAAAMAVVTLSVLLAVAVWARPMAVHDSGSSELAGNIERWATWKPYDGEGEGRGEPAAGAGSVDSVSEPGGLVPTSDGPTNRRIAQIKAGLRQKRATASEMAIISNAQRNSDSKWSHYLGCERNSGDPAGECIAPGLGRSAALDRLGLKSVVLIGNSIAMQWGKLLADQLPRGSNLVSLGLGACVPFDLKGVVFRNHPDNGLSCPGHARWTDQQVRRLRPQLAVISSSSYDRAKLDGYRAVRPWIERNFTSRGIKVLFIGSVPTSLGWDKCLKGANDISRCATTSFAQGALDPGIKVGVQQAGGYYWELQPLFCVPDGCPAVMNGYPVRLDFTHLSIPAMKGVLPQLSAAIRKAMAIPAPRKG